tara:strand:- start:3974 stop:4153 length:180 start_codon:yes stop_codon:yes gene_type:complete
VEGLHTFCSADAIHRDPQVPDGLKGEKAPGSYPASAADWQSIGYGCRVAARARGQCSPY